MEIEGRRYNYSNDDTSPKKSKQRQLSVSYFKLFCFADGFDYLLMTVGGISALAHGVCLPVFLIVFGKLIDALGNVALQTQGVMAQQVSKYALYFVYLAVIRLVTGWIDISLWMYTGDRQSAKMRMKYVRSLISQEVGFFDTDVSAGEAVVGIASDTALIQDAVGIKTGSIIQFFAQFASGFVIAFASVWKITLLMLAVIPLFGGTAALCAFIMVGLSSRSQKAYVKAGEIAQEVIGQIRTVQAFVGESKASQSYSESLTECKTIGRRSGIAKGLSIGFIYCLGFAVFALLLWYAGKLIRQGEVSGGIAFTTIMNVLSSTLALGQAAPSIGTISKAKVSGYTVLEVIKRKPKIACSSGDGIRVDKVEGNVEFREVVFSYPSRPDVEVLQSLSLKISAGKAIAIVGGSGSGKSTVISLIQRFYDPKLGEILLDGHNIKSMDLKWLRDQMGLVSQEPALFATTIRENIMYGKDGDVSMDEIVKATLVSCAHDFISALPESYETQVGERGTQLSGGQKQRIAIARAVLKNPSILLLDEATSALDSESEKGVQEALDKVMVGRTTLVVAHRLSTIQNADMIAVLQHGQVAEIGTHTELLENGGVYASLVKAQEKAPVASSVGSKLDNRTAHGSFRGSISRRLSFNGSASQRTFSFRSNAESVISIGDKMNEMGVVVDDCAGTKPSMRRLFKMNAREWPYGLMSALAAILAGSLTPVFALVITLALEYFYAFDPEEMISGLKKVAMYCCISGVVVLFAYLCEFYFSEVAGENITMRIRSMMFSAILKNEITWFDQNNSMVIASRLSNDAPLVRTTIIDRNITLLQNMGLIVTALVITIRLNWKVALVTMSMFPFLILSFVGQMQFIKGFSGDLNKAYLRANMVAGEAVSNIRTVAAFSAEDKVMKLFSKQLEKSKKKSFVRGQIAGLFYGFSQFVLPCAYGFSLWYASGLIRKGEADFGQVMKCFMVLIITSFGVAEALSLAPDILRGTETLRAVFNILDRQTEISGDDVNGIEANNVKGNVEFKHVDFYYLTRPDVQVFKDFNLKMRAGHSLAMVGASGSGKSSVIALIMRFYDPQAGRVLIDGKDIRQYKLKSLRQHMGLVQQEPMLFSTSIYDNIAYGKDGATEAEIIEAAKAANAHSFISSLPDGYMTHVGDRGVQLSGGQKQRVAIARAVLRNPAILLLDEATSALDAQSEKLVQDALDRLMQGRTTVLVAHRLSTIKNAESIAVLQDGSIVEQGTHTELLAKKGAYFNLQNLAHTHEEKLS